MKTNDYYAEITKKIVESIKSGVLPWNQPYRGYSGRPTRANGQPYRGSNVLVLWMEAAAKGYVSDIWMTFRQANEFGGAVRKGQKGTHIIYLGRGKKTVEDANGDEIEKGYSFARTYCVFNLDQIDGIDKSRFEKGLIQLPEENRIIRADEWIKEIGANVQAGPPAYSEIFDVIRMPAFGSFVSPDAYYSTYFHELVHWTKRKGRLERDLGGKRFGDAGYAVEELVAELGAAFICADLEFGKDPRADHASYISSWLKVLKNDPRAIFTASSHAEKAAGYLHLKAGFNVEEEEEREVAA